MSSTLAWWRAIPLFLGLVGFFAPPALAQDQTLELESLKPKSLKHQASGLIFPAKLGNLRLIKSVDYESQAPGLGSGYFYEGSGAATGVHIVVYVYNLRLKEVPSDLKDPKFGQIRQMTRQEIVQAARTRDLSARAVVGTTLGFGAVPAERQALFDGFVLESRLKAQSEPQAELQTELQAELQAEGDSASSRNRGYEFAALWSARKHFIKLKVSRSEQSSAGPELIQDLVRQWMVALE